MAPAPSYVKFYKYEEVKKNLDLQNYKDLLREKLKRKIKRQGQSEIDTF